MLSINLFHLLLFPIHVTSQHFQRQYKCATFTHNDTSPRIMITTGVADNIGNALATKLQQMNFTSVKVLSDNGASQHTDHIIQMNRTRPHQGSRDVCVGNLNFEKTSRALFVNADWVIHLANSDVRYDLKDRSALLHRFLHIDSNVLKAVRHNNVTKYLYVGMAHTGIVDPSTARAESDIYPKHPYLSPDI